MVIYLGLSDDSHLCWWCWAEWKLVTMKDLPNLLWMTGNLYPVIHNITTVQMQHTSLLFIPLSYLFKHLWLIWRRVSQYPSHCLVAGGSLWHVETMNIRLKVRLQVSSCVGGQMFGLMMIHSSAHSGTICSSGCVATQILYKGRQQLHSKYRWGVSPVITSSWMHACTIMCWLLNYSQICHKLTRKQILCKHQKSFFKRL